MKTRQLNLARRPFVNARPVRRLTALLWLVGAGLCILNVVLFWNYFSTTDDSQQERLALEQRIQQHSARIAENKAVLAKVDLVHLNSQVDFLNGKIAERTFPWSQLFDHLAEVLPDNVRLQKLAPTTEDRVGRSDRVVLPGGRVRMTISGIAKTVEDELEFVDRLFAHPSFERPRLKADSIQQDRFLRFNLGVTYFPVRPSSVTSGEALEADRNQDEDVESTTATPRSRLAATGVEALPPSSPRRTGTPRPPVPVALAQETPAAEAPSVASARRPLPRAREKKADVAPTEPDRPSRRNRRRGRSTETETPAPTPTVAGGIAGLLPQRAPGGEATRSTSTNRRRGGARRSGGGNRRRRNPPGIPLPGGDSDGEDTGARDPRDPRRPSPRTPPASSTLEIQ